MERVKQYVEKALEKGYSHEHIKKKLVQAGWPEHKLSQVPALHSKEEKLMQQVIEIEKSFEDYRKRYEEEKTKLASAMAEIEDNRKGLQKKHDAYVNELSEIEKIKEKLMVRENELMKKEQLLFDRESGLEHKDKHLQTMQDTIAKRADELEGLKNELQERSERLIREKLEIVEKKAAAQNAGTNPVAASYAKTPAGAAEAKEGSHIELPPLLHIPEHLLKDLKKIKEGSSEKVEEYIEKKSMPKPANTGKAKKAAKVKPKKHAKAQKAVKHPARKPAKKAGKPIAHHAPKAKAKSHAKARPKHGRR
jgi:hypothetical protein